MKQLWISPMVLALGLTGCSKDTGFVGQMFEEVGEPQSLYTTIDEQFVIKDGAQLQVTVPKPVDILIAIDNSGSMQDEQALLAAGMQSFADNYLRADKDIRIGFINSDTWNAGDTTNANYSYMVPTIGIDNRDYARLFAETNGGKAPPAPVAVADRADAALIHTVAPSGQSPNDWINYLKGQFLKLSTRGLAGHSNEDNMKSMEKLLDVNDAGMACDSPSRKNPCMFLPGNRIKVLVSVTDEAPGFIKDGATRAAFKTKLDNKFKALTGTVDPQYFMVSISNEACTNANLSISGPAGLRAYADFVNLLKTDTTNSLAQYSSDNPVNAPVAPNGTPCTYANQPRFANVSNYGAYFFGLAQTLSSVSGQTITASRFGLRKPPLLSVPSQLPVVTLFVPGAPPVTLTQDKYIFKGEDMTLNLRAEDYPVGTKITIRYYLANEIEKR